MENIARKAGFTLLEIKVILFLAVIFLGGLVVNFLLTPQEKSKLLEFDYAEEDSIYFSSSLPEKIVEKRVDSKQELLDFSVDKSSVSSEENFVLLEKSINLNTAGIEQFMKLPGIGIKTAENIVRYRNEISGFAEIDQLIEVKGIGKVKLNNIRKYVFVDKN